MGGEGSIKLEDEVKNRLMELLSPRGYASKISRESGIPYNTLVNWRSGRNLPTVTEAYKLCKAIDKSLEWLVTGKKEQPLDNTEKEIIKIIRENGDDMKNQFLGIVRGYNSLYGESEKGATGSETRAG